MDTIINSLAPVFEGLNRAFGPIGFLAMLGILVLLIGITLFQLSSQSKKRKELRTIVQAFETEEDAKIRIEKSKTKKKGDPYTKLKGKIDKLFMWNPKPGRAQNIFIAIIAVEAILFIAFLVMQKYILAIGFPLAFHWIASGAISLLTVTMDDLVQKELPMALKHIIKVMTKSSDLKIVFYEASKGVKEPLRSEFVEISRKMVTESHEKVLMEFGEKVGNIWTYAFTFIMLSYKESSKKEDIIGNLALLANMLDRENYMAEKSITEKKSVVILNYGLIFMATIAFFANLFLNEYAAPFFLESIGGMMCLIIGFLSIGATFLINLMLTRKQF